jgi:DNA repair protein RecO (recombination protein O)
MASEKSLAIVLRVVDFSETSCIVTLFTREFGKISALAKGARRPKSPFESALDLLAICRIVFLHKSSEALDLLTEANLERRFRAASRDLSRLYAGYYIAELLRDMTDAADPHPQLYEVAERTIEQLDGHGEVAATVLRFEMTALRVLGHLPALFSCAACGRPVELGRHVAFGQLAGGLLCPRCRQGQKQVVRVAAGTIRTLQQYATADANLWRRIRLDARTRGEIRGLMNQYLTSLLGHRLQMHRYLGVLAGTLT